MAKKKVAAGQNFLSFLPPAPKRSKNKEAMCPWCGNRHSWEAHRIHVCEHMTPGLQSGVRKYEEKLRREGLLRQKKSGKQQLSLIINGASHTKES